MGHARELGNLVAKQLKSKQRQVPEVGAQAGLAFWTLPVELEQGSVSSQAEPGETVTLTTGHAKVQLWIEASGWRQELASRPDPTREGTSYVLRVVACELAG